MVLESHSEEQYSCNLVTINRAVWLSFNNCYMNCYLSNMNMNVNIVIFVADESVLSYEPVTQQECEFLLSLLTRDSSRD
jgi:hypothetical protein